MSFHQTIVAGRLSADPEPLGDSGAKFAVPVTEKWTTKDGEQREHTEWYNCQVNGGQARSTLEYLKKGSWVTLTGTMRTRKVEDGRVYHNFVVRYVDFGPRPYEEPGDEEAPPF